MYTATTADPDSRPTDLLKAATVLHRPERAPDLQAEAAAFGELSRILADELEVDLVMRVVEIAIGEGEERRHRAVFTRGAHHRFIAAIAVEPA